MKGSEEEELQWIRDRRLAVTSIYMCEEVLGERPLVVQLVERDEK